MFGFTRKTDYALVALATLVQHDAAADRPMSARRLAQVNGLPLPLLMQVLKEMHRAGIISSQRGAGGGYYLARSPDEVDLVSVIESIEGPLRVAACCDDEAEVEPCTGCNLIQRCPITGAVRRINEMILAYLCRITVQNLIDLDDKHWPQLDHPVSAESRSMPVVPRKELP